MSCIQHGSETEVHSNVVSPFLFPHSSKPCLHTSRLPRVLIADKDQKELGPDPMRLYLHGREMGEAVQGSSLSSSNRKTFDFYELVAVLVMLHAVVLKLCSFFIAGGVVAL